jgi:replicative DNA helicase
MQGNLEAENYLISSVMNYGLELFDDIQDQVLTDDFVRPQNKLFWDSFKKCSEDRQPIDPVGVFDSIPQNKKDSSGLTHAVWAEMMRYYPDIKRVPDYIGIVKKHSLSRQSIFQYQQRIQQLQNGADPNDVVSQGILEDSERLDKNSRQEKIQMIGDGILDFVDDLEAKIRAQKSITGLRTGYDALDYILGGLDPDTINILAAPPGTGKTTKVINIARTVAINFGPVYFASLEMSKEQLQGKFLALEAQMDSMAFRNVNLLKLEDIDHLTQKASKLSNYPIIIDDSTETKASDILIRGRKLKKKYGIKLIIIDFFQLMKPEYEIHGNSRAELNGSLRVLKKIGRELRIPIYLICQLNRDIYKRKDPKPVFSDLNETGNLEQAASSIQFLYRRNDDPEWVIRDNIAKNRYGIKDKDVLFDFFPEKSTFKLAGATKTKTY